MRIEFRKKEAPDLRPASGGDEGHPSVAQRERDALCDSDELSRVSAQHFKYRSTCPQLDPSYTMMVTNRVQPLKSRPIFVMGSARSGTSLVGAYIGSSPHVLDVGEYFAFHLTHKVAPLEMGNAPSPFRDAYLRSVQRHALEFASEISVSAGCKYFCDSTPWNIESSRSLVAMAPSYGVYVLLVRHYAGVVLSLEDSYDSGRRWAGATWEQRAQLWKRCYDEAIHLPPERTIAISYDRLCAEPGKVLSEMHEALGAFGFPVSTLDVSVLAKRHAISAGAKASPRQIAIRTSEGVQLQAVPSVDAARWSSNIDERVTPIVRETSRMLEKRFPEGYDRWALEKAQSKEVAS